MDKPVNQIIVLEEPDRDLNTGKNLGIFYNNVNLLYIYYSIIFVIRQYLLFYIIIPRFFIPIILFYINYRSSLLSYLR